MNLSPATRVMALLEVQFGQIQASRGSILDKGPKYGLVLMAGLRQNQVFSKGFHVLRFFFYCMIAGMALQVGCASAPKSTAPDWIRQASRTVDNGYIVYVGTGQSRDVTNAQFKAEGMALEDLENECSFLPKGTRVEDRFVEKDKDQNVAYVKVAVEFQECAEAQKTLEPSDIKRLANVPFTEQLKRYQDLEETGVAPAKGAVIANNEEGEIPPPPASNPGWNESTHFIVMRQYVAYQKQYVVLSAPTAYPPGSPQSTHFVSTLLPAATQVQQTAIANPTLAKNPVSWSRLRDRPRISRPQPVSRSAVEPRSGPGGYKGALPYIRESDAMKRANRAKGYGPRRGKGKRRKRPLPNEEQ